MYAFEINSTVDELKKLVESNELKIKEIFQPQIQRAETMIDIQCKIATYFAGWWFSGVVSQNSRYRELDKILFAAFHKNIITFFSALKLNSSGLYGSVRPLLRNIFEWLMISKFSSLSENPTVMKKWGNHETIYFSNAVLKKIKKPSPEPLSDFWSVICDHTHATKSSMQVEVDVESKENVKSVAANITVINALLECNYHLLNTHLITSECEYMGKFYYGSKRFDMPEYDVPNLRKEAHSIFKANRADFGKDLKTLVATYKRKWQLSC